MRLRSSREIRGLRAAGNGGKGRKHGRPVVNPELAWRGHHDFCSPAAGTPMNPKTAVVLNRRPQRKRRALEMSGLLRSRTAEQVHPPDAPLRNRLHPFFSLFSLFPPVELPDLG